MARPDWVLFDLNGTLLDPATMAPALGGGAEGERRAHEALRETVRQSMVDTLTGVFRPFSGYLEAALRREVRLGTGGEEGLARALELGTRMTPFPEAGAALECLGHAGLQVGVLTNSATAGAEAALHAAGLRDRLAVVLGCDRYSAYKPDARVYRGAMAELGIDPMSACLVSAHWWDALGARRAGLQAGWVSRSESVLLDTGDEPQFIGPDLLAVAERIAAAPGA